ncbi:pyridoxamine 5'-phosphate oxidase family protein [Actinoplanes sp. NPDC049599]|uniref:pyridoxamine 5'-phosphate oxidase family protein n=1 Tax=Actinoplanes sp. NPDC049599 TaxID=3363903 RepID=UPI0037985027
MAVTPPEPRPAAVRKADVLAKLTAPVADAWVATATPDGPYLVPLTLAWLRDHIVLATDGASRTAAGLTATGTVRLALGTTRDVVMIDARLVETFPVRDAPPWVADGYADGTDWDPRKIGGSYVYLVLRPERIQAWREENEIKGRTLMRDGVWLG